MMVRGVSPWNKYMGHNSIHSRASSQHTLCTGMSMFGVVWAWRCQTFSLRSLSLSFFNIAKVSVIFLLNFKQNVMHICCSLKRAIFWSTGNRRRHNVHSHLTRCYFTFAQVGTLKSMANDTTHITATEQMSSVLTVIVSSCNKSGNFLVTCHIPDKKEETTWFGL